MKKRKEKKKKKIGLCRAAATLARPGCLPEDCCDSANFHLGQRVELGLLCLIKKSMPCAIHLQETIALGIEDAIFTFPGICYSLAPTHEAVARAPALG